MVKLTRDQREAIWKIFLRSNDGMMIEYPLIAYKEFRKMVQPGPGCVMIKWCGMWLGIEPNGYTHS